MDIYKGYSEEEIQNAIYNKPKEHHFNEYNDLNKMYQIGG